VKNPTGSHGTIRQPGFAELARRWRATARAISPIRSRPRHRLTEATRFNPETISLARWAWMLLIALVSIGGFHGARAAPNALDRELLEATGATDRHVRLVVAQCAVVGVLGAIFGLHPRALLWLAYRPSLEQSSHHSSACSAPWVVVVAAMVLASSRRTSRRHVPLGQSRKCRSSKRCQDDRRLLVRSTAPRFREPSFWSSLSCCARLLGARTRRQRQRGAPELLFGLVSLNSRADPARSFFLSVTACVGRRAPIATVLLFRDLARYRARSGSAARCGFSLRRACRRNRHSCSPPISIQQRSATTPVRTFANELHLSTSYPPAGQTIVKTNSRGQLVQVRIPKLRPQLLLNSPRLPRRIAKGLGAQLVTP